MDLANGENWPTAVGARPFSFPHELIDDPSFSVSEKRAILSEWASDLCAVESMPTLRLLPGTNFPVTFSAIMDARQRLEERLIERAQRGSRSEKLGRLVVADFARKKTDGVGRSGI